MFSNIGGLEVVFVAMVALIILGPKKLPEAARQIGKFVSQARKISSGFQREFREAIQEPIQEAEARARGAVTNTKKAIVEPFNIDTKTPAPATKPVAEEPAANEPPVNDG